MDKRLGFVGIIVEDRLTHAKKVNDILTGYGEMIVARLGMPYKEKHKNGVITLVVEATTDEVGALTGKLGKIPGVSVKSALSKKCVVC